MRKYVPGPAVIAVLAGLSGVGAILGPANGAGNRANGIIPPLMLRAGEGWSANTNLQPGPAVWLPDDYLHGQASVSRAISLGIPPDLVTEYLNARLFSEWMPPAAGIGPISDGPEHPFYNNAVARAIDKPPTFRIADLNNAAARNLMPWALDALKKQNALVLQGKNAQTRQARCWEIGVPDIHETAASLFFIQTPTVVLLIEGTRVRHVYMNVPHSKHPEPSWYGDSVGHYEGDTLVVDTIGLDTRTFVDSYRTPHTEQEHVTERFRAVNDGQALSVSFTVDDPGAFYKPWGARRPRYRADSRMREDTCAENNDDKFNQGFEPIPSAVTPDF